MWKSVYSGDGSGYTFFLLLFIQPNYTNIDLLINVGILARHLTRSFQPASSHEEENTVGGTSYPKGPTNGSVSTQGEWV